MVFATIQTPADGSNNITQHTVDTNSFFWTDSTSTLPLIGLIQQLVGTPHTPSDLFFAGRFKRSCLCCWRSSCWRYRNRHFYCGWWARTGLSFLGLACLYTTAFTLVNQNGFPAYGNSSSYPDNGPPFLGLLRLEVIMVPP